MACLTLGASKKRRFFGHRAVTIWEGPYDDQRRSQPYFVGARERGGSAVQQSDEAGGAGERREQLLDVGRYSRLTVPARAAAGTPSPVEEVGRGDREQA